MEVDGGDEHEHKHKKSSAASCGSSTGMLKQALVLSNQQLTSSPFGPPAAAVNHHQQAIRRPPPNLELFTREQVERMVTEALRLREEELRAEFTETLNAQLQDQFNVFSAFNRDYVARSMQRSEADYFS